MFSSKKKKCNFFSFPSPWYIIDSPVWWLTQVERDKRVVAWLLSHLLTRSCYLKFPPFISCAFKNKIYLMSTVASGYRVWFFFLLLKSYFEIGQNMSTTHLLLHLLQIFFRHQLRQLQSAHHSPSQNNSSLRKWFYFCQSFPKRSQWCDERGKCVHNQSTERAETVPQPSEIEWLIFWFIKNNFAI